MFFQKIKLKKIALKINYVLRIQNNNNLIKNYFGCEHNSAKTPCSDLG